MGRGHGTFGILGSSMRQACLTQSESGTAVRGITLLLNGHSCNMHPIQHQHVSHIAMPHAPKRDPTQVLTALKASVLQLHRHAPLLICHSCSNPSLHSTSSRPGQSAAEHSSATAAPAGSGSWPTTADSAMLMTWTKGSVPPMACSVQYSQEAWKQYSQKTLRQSHEDLSGA
jgi:hypothetical protein